MPRRRTQRIIGETPTPVTRETAALYDDICALLEERPGADEDGFLERLEHTLTDGYARALTLEAERVRLEKRMGQLAGGLHHDADATPAEELATVARRLADAGDELTRLRGVLRRLRARAGRVRAASI